MAAEKAGKPGTRLDIYLINYLEMDPVGVDDMQRPVRANKRSSYP